MPAGPALRAAALLLALLAPAAAAAEADQLLARMNRAVHELDYSGTLVYGERGRMESMRVYHAGGEGEGERERLVSLTGEPREVVREDGRVTCIGLSEGAPVTYSAVASLPALPAAEGIGASPHYEVALAGTGRVAGREADEIAVRARDAFRYSYRIWVDRSSGMLLKSLRYGADGSTVDQLMFTDIRIGERPDEADLAPSGAAQPLPASAQATPLPAEQARWTVRDLPPGFVLTALSAGAQPREEHHVYSDGLASVSVYVEPASSAEAPPPATSRGAISMFARQQDGFRVLVIGDVPERTAQRIAHGVVARG